MGKPLYSNKTVPMPLVHTHTHTGLGLNQASHGDKPVTA